MSQTLPQRAAGQCAHQCQNIDSLMSALLFVSPLWVFAAIRGTVFLMPRPVGWQHRKLPSVCEAGKAGLTETTCLLCAAVFIWLTNTLGRAGTDQAETLAETWKWGCFKVWLKVIKEQQREKQSARLSCKIAKLILSLNCHVCNWWTQNAAREAGLWLEPCRNKYFYKVLLQKKKTVLYSQLRCHNGVTMGSWGNLEMLFWTQDTGAGTRCFQFFADHNCVTDLRRVISKGWGHMAEGKNENQQEKALKNEGNYDMKTIGRCKKAQNVNSRQKQTSILKPILTLWSSRIADLSLCEIWYFWSGQHPILSLSVSL